jgi:hypothetical protein
MGDVPIPFISFLVSLDILHKTLSVHSFFNLKQEHQLSVWALLHMNIVMLGHHNNPHYIWHRDHTNTIEFSSFPKVLRLGYIVRCRD